MGAREDEPQRARSVDARLDFCFFTPHYHTVILPDPVTSSPPSLRLLCILRPTLALSTTLL